MIFILFLLSHMLADFWFQSDEIAKNKVLLEDEFKKKRKKALKVHVIIHFLTMIIILGISAVYFNRMGYNYSFFQCFLLLLTSIILSGLHYLIDCNFKDFFPNHSLVYKKSFFFLLDQFLHIGSIYLILFFGQLLINNNSIFFDSKSFNFFRFDTSMKYPVLLIIIIFITSFVGVFIQLIFDDLECDHKNENDLERENLTNLTLDKKIEEMSLTNDSTINIIKEFTFEDDQEKKNPPKLSKKILSYDLLSDNEISNYGKLIGYFERLIMFFIIVTGNLEGIPVLLGVKTFSRFKQLESKKFTEKFILGTFISLITSMVLSFIWLRYFAWK